MQKMGKLAEEMRKDMELRNLSPRTIDCYLGHMKNFSAYFNKSPKDMGDNEIRRYLLYLKREKKSSQATINQAYSAMKLFYVMTLGRTWNHKKLPRSKKERRLPTVLSMEEIKAIFAATHKLKYRAFFMTTYSGGLRINETVHLKVSDIDSDAMVIRVYQGKGRKDRHTLIGQTCVRGIEGLLGDLSPQGLVVSQPQGSETAGQFKQCRPGLCENGQGRRNNQTRNRAHASAQFCHPPIGKRRRSLLHPASFGTSLGKYHGHIPSCIPTRSC
jgi:site-specific recombinase XerD